MKKDPINSQNQLDLIEETQRTIEGAANWLLEDVSLLKAYWHDKFAYTEAWVDANWHLLTEESSELVKSLDGKEDVALLWLLNNANNNPVPLEKCSVTTTEVQAGRYICMSCGHENTHAGGALGTCEECHYGLMYYQGE
ncbi:hypothetical protein GV054_15340 [Marinomonas mediterranea]|uniref:hypothetical protein n=1 Tax=Marinomonas mediterranea TaxID=119864 RepID=UPI00234A0C25|nr:hypothetical protein [Marinomonas mediterranea]WCN14267.1 hypothetical protein GV054_15340 [Marinomonas mediterranea]